MSRSYLVTLAGVGLVAVIFGTAVWLGLFSHHTTPAELDSVFRERIPVGSSSQRVETFLDSVGVEHASLSGGQRINATWRRTWVGLVGEKAIGVRFYFDENHRLTKYELEEVSFYL